MSFSVTILGSGTSVPSPGRMAPAFLIQADETAVLLDCGSGSSTSLARQGISLGSLDGIVLTHLHLDHVCDLPAMTFALANPLGPERVDPLLVWGPAGTHDYITKLQDLYGEWVKPRDTELQAVDLAPGHDLVVGPLTIHAHRATHSGECLSYRVEHGGRAVCFSGDTEPCEGLAAAAAGADLLICECSVLEDEDCPGHMKASQVGQVAAAAGVGRLVLSHLYERVAASGPVEVVQSHYDGPVELAADGMVLEI